MENIKELVAKAQAGDYKAKYELGECYYFGEGVEKDYEKAVELFKSVANLEEEDYNGDWDNLYWDVDLAKYLLGELYYYGGVVEKDYKQAVYWFSLSDNANAAKLLADCYYYGRGVEPDYDKALKYYKDAATACHPEAQERYALLMNEQADLQNNNDASKWYYFAFKNCYGLGMKYYSEGEVVSAEKWYNKAVEAFEKYVELECFCLLEKPKYYSEYSLEDIERKLGDYYAWLFTFSIDMI
jgi:TPR repeat protein